MNDTCIGSSLFCNCVIPCCDSCNDLTIAEINRIRKRAKSNLLYIYPAGHFRRKYDDDFFNESILTNIVNCLKINYSAFNEWKKVKFSKALNILLWLFLRKESEQVNKKE